MTAPESPALASALRGIRTDLLDLKLRSFEQKDALLGELVQSVMHLRDVIERIATGGNDAEAK